MKINQINLNNFRQYYHSNSIDLSTKESKNLVLIGGKNGYGKTNFLVGIVWCLYGEKIEKVDDNFKREVKKEGNYSRFLRHSLNKQAEQEGLNSFSVSMTFDGIEIPDTIYNINSAKVSKCVVSRTFNVKDMQDELSITIPGIENIFIDEEDKINFINDYLIPIEAAKFVFFDAEQISGLAALSTKEEGSIMNDALSKILGLDIYESLSSDLRIYSENLKKDSADFKILDQITNAENTININETQIDNLEKTIIDKEKDAEDLKSKIFEYSNYLMSHSKSYNAAENLEQLYLRRDELVNQIEINQNKFNDLAELIPIAIGAGKIEEVIEHIDKQSQYNDSKEVKEDLQNNILALIELLFNRPEFPPTGDISLSQKAFYLQKAEKVIGEMLSGEEEAEEKINFEHDITKADFDFIKSTYEILRTQSKDIFQQAIEKFSILKNELIDVEKTIKRIEVDLQDEKLVQYVNKKEEFERKRDKIIEEIGSDRLRIKELNKQIASINRQKHDLMKKVQVTKQNKVKLDKAEEFIDTLEEFILLEKRSKCSRLESSILNELKRLMHKLESIENDSIRSVKVEVLPGNDGLKVTLFDSRNAIIRKESLSQGEKQIYISSLIKAILSESVQDFPIFIDTPLGRLDDDHIKNTLLYYYPNLARQVVIMATNNEIPPSRYALIQDYLAESYLLDNSHNTTTFKKGYFTS